MNNVYSLDDYYLVRNQCTEQFVCVLKPGFEVKERLVAIIEKNFPEIKEEMDRIEFRVGGSYSFRAQPENAQSDFRICINGFCFLLNKIVVEK